MRDRMHEQPERAESVVERRADRDAHQHLRRAERQT